MAGHAWTQRELDTLRRLYPQHGSPAVEDATGRSMRAIITKAHELGLHRTGRWKGRRWTDREDDLIRRDYGQVRIEALAERLDRSVKATRSRAGRLGLTGQRHGDHGRGTLTDSEAELADMLYARGLSYHAIGDVLGVSHATISRYVLPDIRRGYRRRLITNAKRRLQRQDSQAGRQPPAG